MTLIWQLDTDGSSVQPTTVQGVNHGFTARYLQGNLTTSSQQYPSDSYPFNSVGPVRHSFVDSTDFKTGGKALRVSIPASGGGSQRYQFRVNAPSITVASTGFVERWFAVIHRQHSDTPMSEELRVGAGGSGFNHIPGLGARFTNGVNGPYGGAHFKEIINRAAHWTSWVNTSGGVESWSSSNRGAMDLGLMVLDTAELWVVQERWARDSSGLRNIYRDGVLVGGPYNGFTVYSGGGSIEYRTAGYYRGSGFQTPSTTDISFARLGTTRADVDPGFDPTPPLQPPAIPTGLTRTVLTDRISLAWSAVSAATSYDVFRRRQTVPVTAWTQLTPSPTQPSYVDTPGVGTWEYSVIARNSAGPSGRSAVVAATVEEAPPPVSGDISDPTVVAGLYRTAEAQLKRTLVLLDATPPTTFPHYTIGSAGTWSTVGVQFWTAGFLADACWKTFARTGDTFWRDAAIKWTGPLHADTTWDTHDVGSVFRAMMDGYEIAGTQSYLDDAVAAANTMSARYVTAVGAVKSLNVTAYGFNTLVDSAMSIQLMFWAARNGASTASTLYSQAVSHLNKIRTNHVRPSGGSWQVVTYNATTGAVISKPVRQGSADTSTWARGQAWGIYGFARGAIETAAANPTDSANFRGTAAQMAGYFMDNLPADDVARWDFDAPAADTQKDTSAQVIAAAGMLWLATIDTTRDWRGEADKLLQALVSSTYQASASESYAILKHSVSDKPNNIGVDVGYMPADLWWLEALDLFSTVAPPVLDPDVATVDIDGTTLTDLDVLSVTSGVTVSGGRIIRTLDTTSTVQRLATRDVTVANRSVLARDVIFGMPPAGQVAEAIDSLIAEIDETTRVSVRRHTSRAADGTVFDKIECRLVENDNDAGQVSVDVPAGLVDLGLSFGSDGKTVEFIGTTDGTTWKRFTPARAYATPVFLTAQVTVARQLQRLSGTGTISAASDSEILGSAYITPSATFGGTTISLSDPTGLTLVSQVVDPGDSTKLRVELAWDPVLPEELGATFEIQQHDADANTWATIQAAASNGTTTSPVVVAGLPQGIAVDLAVVKVISGARSGRSNVVSALLMPTDTLPPMTALTGPGPGGGPLVTGIVNGGLFVVNPPPVEQQIQEIRVRVWPVIGGTRPATPTYAGLGQLNAGLIYISITGLTPGIAYNWEMLPARNQ